MDLSGAFVRARVGGRGRDLRMDGPLSMKGSLNRRIRLMSSGWTRRTGSFVFRRRAISDKKEAGDGVARDRASRDGQRGEGVGGRCAGVSAPTLKTGETRRNSG
jgi:hypothetical protein